MQIDFWGGVFLFLCVCAFIRRGRNSLHNCISHRYIVKSGPGRIPAGCSGLSVNSNINMYIERAPSLPAAGLVVRGCYMTNENK